MTFTNIAKPVKRTDFDDKAEGRAKYCADLDMPGMLYARTLRSSHARARILSIHLPHLPDGYFTVDSSDIKGRNALPVGLCDQPFLAESRVNYIGEPILLLVGPDRQVLSELLSKTNVDYAGEEPVFSIAESEQRSSEKIFGKTPYFAQYEYAKGDLDAAAKNAASVVEDEFETGYQEHAYLETQSVIGAFEKGLVSVYGSMQCPYMVKAAIVQALGCAEDEVRVVQLPTGGGFGGKEEYPSIPGVHAALATLKTGKPVKLVFDRKEDIISTTKRHPSSIHIRSYIDADGKITARDVDIKLDAGAYSGLSSVVLQRCSFAACGAYNVENLRVRAKAVGTNNIVSGAFRGFGGPQAFFAMEMHMEHIAKHLHEDSLLLRRKHFLKRGDTSSTGGKFHNHIVLEKIADSVVSASGYHRKRAQYEHDAALRRSGQVSAGPMRGIGISTFFHGCGFTGSGERDVLKAKATLRKLADGRAEILVSSAEMGQGCMTTLRKIVAEAIGIPLEKVSCPYPDTMQCPDSGPTVASRTTMVVGKILLECADEAKRRWREDEFTITRQYKYPEELEWDQVALHGNAYPEYSWGANVIEVEVDPITCEISVKGAWTAFDIGAPIDERIVAGQIDGGMAQGLGYGAMEVLVLDRGRTLQDNLTTYAIPTSMDLPRIDNKLIRNPYPDGPYGAKGLGELPLIGTAPALAAAVEQALGRQITRIPLTPEYLLRLMDLEMQT